MAVIKNLDKLVSKLDSLNDFKSVMEQACLLVENQAKIDCPVDSGQLRSSITHNVDASKNEIVGTVGTNIEYAPYVEYGTGIWAVNGDGRQERWSYQDAEGNWHSTIGQHPQPFLEPALAKKDKEIVKLFKDKIEKGVKKK